MENTRYSHLFCQKKSFLEFSMRRSDKSSKGHGPDQPAKSNGHHSSKSTFCLTRYPSLGPVLNYVLASLNPITRSTRPSVLCTQHRTGGNSKSEISSDILLPTIVDLQPHPSDSLCVSLCRLLTLRSILLTPKSHRVTRYRRTTL